MEDIQTEDQEMRLTIHSVIHYHTCTPLYSILFVLLAKIITVFTVGL